MSDPVKWFACERPESPPIHGETWFHGEFELCDPCWIAIQAAARAFPGHLMTGWGGKQTPIEELIADIANMRDYFHGREHVSASTGAE